MCGRSPDEFRNFEPVWGRPGRRPKGVKDELRAKRSTRSPRMCSSPKMQVFWVAFTLFLVAVTAAAKLPDSDLSSPEPLAGKELVIDEGDDEPSGGWKISEPLEGDEGVRELVKRSADTEDDNDEDEEEDDEVDDDDDDDQDNDDDGNERDHRIAEKPDDKGPSQLAPPVGSPSSGNSSLSSRRLGRETARFFKFGLGLSVWG